MIKRMHSVRTKKIHKGLIVMRIFKKGSIIFINKKIKINKYFNKNKIKWRKKQKKVKSKWA